MPKEERSASHQSCSPHRLVIDPEGHPGDDDDHEAGDVDGDDEEGELPGEGQLNPQAAIGACGWGKKSTQVQYISTIGVQIIISHICTHQSRW